LAYLSWNIQAAVAFDRVDIVATHLAGMQLQDGIGLSAHLARRYVDRGTCKVDSDV